MPAPVTMAARPQKLPSLSIFVDGTNFHIACRQDYQTKVDVAKLKSHLIAGYHFQRLYYYTSPLPSNTRDLTRLAKERAFFAELRQMHGLTLFTGYHERHVRHITGRQLTTGNTVTIEHEYHVEKQCDVQLAVDMVRLALKPGGGESYEVAMLLSNDADLVPAVQLVRDLGKRVVWCRLDRQSQHGPLEKACGASLVLTAADLAACV